MAQKRNLQPKSKQCIIGLRILCFLEWKSWNDSHLFLFLCLEVHTLLLTWPTLFCLWWYFYFVPPSFTYGWSAFSSGPAGITSFSEFICKQCADTIWTDIGSRRIFFPLHQGAYLNVPLNVSGLQYFINRQVSYYDLCSRWYLLSTWMRRRMYETCSVFLQHLRLGYL